SPAGHLSYSSAAGFLISGAIQPTACFDSANGPYTHDMELRLIQWSGPNLSAAYLDPSDLAFPPGLFWSQAPTNGAFPAPPPPCVLLEGPPFVLEGRGLPPREVTPSGVLTLVPEPATLSMVALGV